MGKYQKKSTYYCVELNDQSSMIPKKLFEYYKSYKNNSSKWLDD